jgi:dienelactone hydrolase
MSGGVPTDPPTAVPADAAPWATPHEHHLTVARSARYVLLGEPSPRVRRLWVALHGYAQLAARFARRCTPLAAPDRLVAVPEALSRFYVESATGGSHAQARIGATWMTREDRLAEISDYVGYLDQLHALLAERCGGAPELRVLGFSQGAATAARWAAFGGASVRGLVLWGGLAPDDLPLDALAARLAGAPVTIVRGDADAHGGRDAAMAQADALRAAGIAARVEVFAGGHHLDAGVLGALADA